MKYSTIVEKDESGLQMIIEAAEQFDKNKFINALYDRRLKLEEVLELTEDIRGYRAKLRMEHLALCKFAITFNERYATENNQCFNIANKLFNKIRSTISSSKKVYKKFCKPNRNKQPINLPQAPSIFKRSSLVNNYYNGALFSLDSYDESVQRLYDELEGFVDVLAGSLTLCRMVIDRELLISNTPELCIPIYNRCYDEMVANSSLMIQQYRKLKFIPEDEYFERKKNARSLQENICHNFHKLDPSQWNMHVLVRELTKGEADGLSDVEVQLYGNNVDLVKKVRIIIEHFDELKPEGHKGKLDAKAVTALMLWSDIGKTLDNKIKLFVEEYFNKSYHGIYKTVTTGAVNAAKNKTLQNTDKEINTYQGLFNIILQKHAKNNVVEMKKMHVS